MEVRDHAKELGNAIPTQPFFFLKPTSSYISSPGPIRIPNPGAIVHHEVELGVIIGKPGFRISEKEAWGHVDGSLLI